jgi:hypothetical protein
MPARRRADDDQSEDHVGERQTDWMKGAPRWLLLWGLIGSTMVGTTFGTLSFNLVMFRLEEIRSVQVAPAIQGVADLDGRINRLEIRVAAIENHLPTLTAKVEKIDVNVERLLRRR